MSKPKNYIFSEFFKFCLIERLKNKILKVLPTHILCFTNSYRMNKIFTIVKQLFNRFEIL